MSTPTVAAVVAIPQPGEVYWVDVPKSHTVGQEQYDHRPYVVLSVESVNARGTVVGVPLTSVKDPSKVTFLPSYWIFIPQKELTIDWGAVVGHADSMAKTEQIRVLDAKRLGTRIGRVSLTALAAIRLGAAYVINLDP